MEDNFKNIIQEKFDNIEGVPPIGGWNSIKNEISKKPAAPPFGYFLIPLGVILGGLLFSGGYYFGKSNNGDNNNTDLASANNANQIVLVDGVSNESVKNTADLASAQLDPISEPGHNKEEYIGLNNTSKINSIDNNEVLNSKNVLLADASSKKTNPNDLKGLAAANGNAQSDESANNSNKEVKKNSDILLAKLAGVEMGEPLNDVLNSEGNDGTANKNSNATSINNGNKIGASNGSIAKSSTNQDVNAGAKSDATNNHSDINSHLPKENIFAATFPQKDLSSWGQAVDLTKSESELDAEDNNQPESENNEDATSKEPNKILRKNAIKLGVYGAMIHNHKSVIENGNSGSNIDDWNYGKSISTEKIGYEIGLNARKRIASRFYVGTGIGVTQINDNIEYVLAGNPQVSVIKIQENKIQVDNNETHERQYDIKLHYASLNANFEYEILVNRLSIITGIGYNMLVHSDIRDSHNFPMDSDKIASSNVNGTIGIAFTKQLTEEMNLRIQPTFNYYIKQAISSDFNSKPYNFGIRLNLVRK